MNDELIAELSILELEEKYYLRILNMTFYDSKKKNEIFNKLKEIKKRIRKVKFKLRVNWEMKKNEKSRKKI